LSLLFKATSRLTNSSFTWQFIVSLYSPMMTGGAPIESGSGTGSSQYNGLANSRCHSLLFGINRLTSDAMPHFGAKCHHSGPFVQLLCDRYFAQETDHHNESFPTGLFDTPSTKNPSFDNNMGSSG
jgi:hypothetical protein